MGFILFSLFIVVPLLEIVVFIQVGGLIGLWPTLAGVVATAVAGVTLLRHQGLTVLRRAFETAHAGHLPTREVFEGFCLVIAGAFLLTPGFVTDSLGFLLLVPAVRRWLRTTVGERLVRAGTLRVTIDGERIGPAPPRPHKRGGVVIDAEYETMPPEPQRDDKPPATPPEREAGQGADSNPSSASEPDTDPKKPSPWST